MAFSGRTRIRKTIARDVDHSWSIVLTGNGELPLWPSLPYTKLNRSLLSGRSGALDAVYARPQLLVQRREAVQ